MDSKEDSEELGRREAAHLEVQGLREEDRSLQGASGVGVVQTIQDRGAEGRNLLEDSQSMQGRLCELVWGWIWWTFPKRVWKICQGLLG